jgi:HlyD family secretion protein
MNVAASPFGDAVSLPPTFADPIPFDSDSAVQSPVMHFRRISSVLIATVLVACQSKSTGPAPLPTTTVTRGDIAVRVQATGTVEPINPVDIKSKASGMIIRMPVEVGARVERGALIAQIDPRDVKNQFDQAMADDVVSAVSLVKADRDRARKDSLFVRHVIAMSEHDSSKSTYATAVSDMINKRASLDLARQRMEDATLEAPIGGTVISRPVTQGQIITAATSPNGGTTLMTIADLARVRMRVTIDEVEMGNIRVGEQATVQVDAFPDHAFAGVIEKIEPQAVVTQGVTFFPVLVSISNKDGLLMPGMNGEVTIKAADLTNVIEVPIDAIRPTNELAPVARMFSLAVDTLTSQLRRDLVGGQGTGVPGRYAVVALPGGTYEMRLVKTGPTDLRVTQIVDGLKQGDKVVMLGAIITARPTVPPKLQIAEDMKRGAPIARPSQAGQPSTPPASATAPRP